LNETSLRKLENDKTGIEFHITTEA